MTVAEVLTLIRLATALLRLLEVEGREATPEEVAALRAGMEAAEHRWADGAPSAAGPRDAA